MQNNKVNITENGLFVRGVVVSSTAKAIQMKDGSGPRVIISHEIGTQPGVVIWDQFLDPRERTDVRLKDDQVAEYPKLDLYKPVTVQVSAMEASKGRTVIKRGQVIA
ncbi:hypothetical protein [Cerasicoccus fimbriatus]|uniref:hypothetical protein n=1 Tax=Cerasicoccus fimbriatus TaxID=3014554 RepID=UPI0022B53215|nr:hypothetical protein [Cerasicoccus sp. TK19100]